MFKYLLLDLDNTLYSCHYGLEDNVSRRIMEYAAAFMGTTPEDALRQRKETMHQYGTCLEWLMSKGFADVEAYLAYVHPDGEVDPLVPDGELRAFLAGIPIPKAILTNSPREHAELVLEKLVLSDLFTHIFDIRLCNFMGKPRREVFDNALNILGVSIDEVLFVDDHPPYAQGFADLGGKAILFDEDDVHKASPLPRIRNLKELTKYIF